MKKYIKIFSIILTVMVILSFLKTDIKAIPPAGCSMYCWCGTLIACECSPCSISGQEMKCCGYTFNCNLVC